MLKSQIIRSVEKLVRDACIAPGNPYGERYWRYHIQIVVKLAKKLAKQNNVDAEIMELAALLHDYGQVIDPENAKNHHITGAKQAKIVLLKYNYPTSGIKLIQKCILSHRGSTNISKTTKEERILADADAMSHILNLPNLFYYAYSIAKMDVGEGKLWVKNELEKCWSKMSDRSQKLVIIEYKAAKLMLN